MSAHVYTPVEVEGIARALGGARRSGEGWKCRCPAHDDRDPSLTLSVGENGTLLWRCQAGCTQDAVRDGLRKRKVLPNGDAREAGPEAANGRTIAAYPYVDEQGRLLFEKLRKEPKSFTQRRPDGRGGHVYRLGDVRRVLYNLPQVLAAEEVVVVEGEKDADRLLSLGFVATTNVEGASEDTRKPKWRDDYSTALKGKRLVLIPDNDAAGRAHMEHVARSCLAAGAGSVKLIRLEGLPAKGDLSDWLDAGHTADELRGLVAEAPERERPTEAQLETEALGRAGERQQDFLVVRAWGEAGNGERHRPGVYKLVEKEDKETGEKERSWSWFCSPLEVVAETRDAAGERWGRLLRVTDRDGTAHAWAMPMDMLAGDGVDYRRHLLSLGLELAPGRQAGDCLHELITVWRPEAQARCVEQTGWHGSAFVLPDVSYGDTAGESVLLQTTGAAPGFEVTGTLEDWRAEVARHAVGNSRLALGISAAFAGPLLHLLGDESGGFHLVGGSSTGKTTALHCAASAWGVPVHSWRATDNAAEALARGASDALLCLDEVSQADGRAVDAIAYMLGNGAGKARMRRDATARPVITWRVLFLSTGETGLAAKMREAGRRARAGQEVRVVEVPADAGAGLGVFEDLHGLASGDALARHLRLAAERYKGHAARAFLDEIAADPEATAAATAATRDAWIRANLPAGADGQVSRVARRFGLVAAAGELATALGILPWPEGEAERAAARCFRDWLRARGGAGPAERREGLAQVRAFLEAHGSSRFEAAWPSDAVPGAGEAPDTLVRTTNRAGFRRLVGEGRDGRWEYYVLPEVWRQEVCKGLDAKAVAQAMADGGWLEKGEDKHLAKTVRVPGVGKTRVYVVKADFLGGGGGEPHAGG